MNIFHDVEIPLGLGTLKLCTSGRPDPLEAQNLIVYALNNGLRIVDTADSYCLNESEAHYGEHLVRQSLQRWSGSTDDIRVITKTGLVRPGGKWIPCGHPQHLKKSIDESLKALGLEQCFLILLHARDPQVPFEDSVGALHEIASSGKALHVGLCNVSLAEVEQARSITTIASVQNELSVLNTQSAQMGLVRYCEQNNIAFLAHRPLGGHAHTSKLGNIEALNLLGERYGASSHEIALAALRDVSANIIPLVGATRLKSVTSSLKAMNIHLDVSDRTAISAFCEFKALQSIGVASSTQDRGIQTDIGPQETAELVVVMGIQGAGKSELVSDYTDAGYARLNRDETGGTLEGLVPLVEEHILAGRNRVVLDNTYATQASRSGVIRMGLMHGIPVRCVFLNTPINEAMINVVQRMLGRYGLPLGPDEMKFFRKADPNLPPPQALQRWLSSYEPPTVSEGFSQVAEIRFQRRATEPRNAKGLFLDVDGTLRKTLSGEVYPRFADDVVLMPNRTAVCQEWAEAGYQLFFVSNQSGIAAGRVSHEAVQAAMMKTAELLQAPVTEIVYCSHPARPVGCFCRKPYPGLGVYLAERHQLAYDEIVMVGDRESDSDFARSLGVTYFDEGQFFGTGRPLPNGDK